MKHIQIRNSDMAWHIAANIQFPPNLMSQNSIRRLSASILLAVVRSRRLAISMAKHWLKKAISFSLMTPVSRENLVGSLAG
ncbi:hydrolase [Escherichia coli]|nr:hydrolase [Escherichia coli]